MKLLTHFRRFFLRFRLQIAASDLALMERMVPDAMKLQRQKVAALEQRLERVEQALEQGDVHA